jgi:cytochrome c peroxidase
MFQRILVCQLAILALAAHGCALTSDEAVWVSDARLALSPPEAAKDPAYVYTGSFTDALEFFRPHATGNGRACATCHRPEDNFALTPQTVEARWQLLQTRRREDPEADDPLFRSIDADDFGDDFTTLRTQALVRVILPLPDNVRNAADETATTLAVFRAVPTVMNTAFTAPFQSDGREASLEEQAHHAMLDHSQVRTSAEPQTLTRIANFQRQLFSSRQARALADSLADNPNLRQAPVVTHTKLERQGQKTFEQFCASCHGGPTLAVNEDARFLPVGARGPRSQGAEELINIFVQTPRPPPPIAPPPAPATPHFFEGLPSADLPIIELSVLRSDASRASVKSSDAGSMLISGDLRENGRFAVPTLFGAAATAPYFHDNSAKTLEAVIEHYQALFKLMAFLDVEAGLFAPATNGQGCERGTCKFAPIPEADIPGLLVYLRAL